MSFSWSGIRDDLARSSSTLQSQRDYRAIRSIEPALQPHADIAALLGVLHHGQLDHDCRNTMLLALVRASLGTSPSALRMAVDALLAPYRRIRL